MGLFIPGEPPPYEGQQLLKGLGSDLAKGPWFATNGCVLWQETQWIAKFRGVPFAVHTDARSGGRRIQTHEFPGRNSWVNEDLGRLKHLIDVDGFVFGDRSDEWAELLFHVCTSDGFAPLFLPVRVPLDARCLTISSTWSEDEQGRISFNMRFVIEPDSGKKDQVPTIVKNRSSVFLSAVVDNSAKTLVSSARNTFETDFTGDQAHVGRTRAADMIRLASAQLRRAYKQARTKLAEAAKIEFAIQRMQILASELADSQRLSADKLTATAAIRTQRIGRSSHLAAVAAGLKIPPNPLAGLSMRASTNQVMNAVGRENEGFGGTFSDALQILAQGAPDPIDLVQALLPLTQLTINALKTSNQTSAAMSTKAEFLLAGAIADFVRRLGLAAQSSATIKVAPERQTDALPTRQRIMASINQEISLTADKNDVWEALRSLRGSVVDYIAYWSQNGPGTIKIRGLTTRTLAAVAADTYSRNKVTDRDRQLMKLNKIRHPLHAQAELSALKE